MKRREILILMNIDLQKSTITVESEGKGKGSRFCISLPAKTEGS